MSAIVICMASAKGGSGKTTLTATFASVLAEIGKKVLIIDCDEATHGLTLLYLKDVNDRANRSSKTKSTSLGIFDSLDELEPPTETGSGVKTEYFTMLTIGNGISFIPATFTFSQKLQMTPDNFSERLRIVINHVRSRFDYIILDAQAGADIVSEVAIRRGISDEVVIVSEYDPLSAAGIERLKSIMGENLNYSRTWILLNKMLPEFVSSFSEFLSVARYLPPIPWTADVVRAYSKRELALDFEVGNQFTLAVMRTLRSLLPHSDGLLLEKWAASKAAALRQPIEDQYIDQQNKLKFIYTELDKLSSRSRLDAAISVFVLLSAILLIGYYTIYLASPTFATRILSIFTVFVENGSLSASIIAVITGVIGLFASLSNLLSRGDSAPRRVRRDTLLRQKELAEADLKNIEALRIADLDFILKNKNRRP